MFHCAEPCGRFAAMRWFAAADRLITPCGSIPMLTTPCGSISTTPCGWSGISTTPHGWSGISTTPRRWSGPRGPLRRRFRRRGGRDGRTMLHCARRCRCVSAARWFTAPDQQATLRGYIRLGGPSARRLSRGAREGKTEIFGGVASSGLPWRFVPFSSSSGWWSSVRAPSGATANSRKSRRFRQPKVARRLARLNNGNRYLIAGVCIPKDHRAVHCHRPRRAGVFG